MGCKCLFKVVPCFLMSLPNQTQQGMNVGWTQDQATSRAL